MAISRHSEEWKRTIATAALLGVTFSRYFASSKNGYQRFTWHARWFIDGCPAECKGTSQIEVARHALLILGAAISNLPDAAKKRAPRSGANELRSSQ